MDFPRPSPFGTRWGRGAAVGICLLGLAGVFLVPADWLIGSPQADVGQQFLAWRAFAAAGLRAGHLPLWNPYTYAGEPFLAGFQAAVFYPLNLIFLVLPVARAINLSWLIHGAVLAGGMIRWARQRGLQPGAALLCGLVLPLSGPFFPQLYAGHLPNWATLAWAPWLFAGLEAWYRQGARRGLLLAAAAVALQILAGQIQLAFFCALAAALQAAAGCAVAPPPERRRLVPGLLLAYLGGAVLAAAQLLPALAAAGENVRQGPLAPAFAGQFSLPPENLLTLAVPGFFGNAVRTLYWGRCYAWEMSLFVGVAGLALLAVGLADATARRAAGRDGAVAAGLLLLALGRHTPLFALMSAALPGLDRFRGWSKFSGPAMLFVVLGIGAGADALLRRRRPASGLAPLLGALGGAFLAGGLFLATHPEGLAAALAAVQASAESYLPAATFAAPAVRQAAGLAAGQSLILAGLLALGCALLLRWARTHPRAGLLLLALVPAEMLGFASSEFAHFRASAASPPEVAAFVAAHPGNYRVQNLLAPNNGFLVGAPDIWGNDPALLRRYAEFITFTQGADPNQATQNVTFRLLPALYRLLRLRYLFTHAADGLRVYETPGALAQVQLVSAYQRLSGRDEIFAALSAPSFDPLGTVLLEQAPVPRPVPSAAPGWARVVQQSPDALTIEAEVAAPALLLVTDGYSRDWQARPLPGSSQPAYAVLPADYVLRATPLAAGHHLIQMDYRPRGLAAGLWISALAWAAWAGLGLRERRRA